MSATITLTDEEKTKFDALLKERGYDEHASKTLEKTREEAKTHRLAKEAAEAEARKLKEAATAREASDAKAKEEADRKAAEEAEKNKTELQKAIEASAKSLEEAFNRKLTKIEEKGVKDQEKALGELKKRDARILMQSVKNEAIKEGVIDDAIADLLDIKDVEIVDGEPNLEKIVEIIAEHKKAKPHLYGDEEAIRTRVKEQRAAEEGRPDAKKGPGKGVDWGALSDEEFRKAEEKLRVGGR